MCPGEKRSPPLYGHSASVLVPQASGTRGAARSLTGGSKSANRFDSEQQFLSFGQTAHRLNDYSKGFGGKYGVERDKVDKAALGYDYKAETEKHESQKDYSKGFGGKYGVEREKVDKAALGYDYKAETEKHESQKGRGSPCGQGRAVQVQMLSASV
ncbi:UNVERIFIED_CONTAM: hypothetical protein FKN15_044869 [Acipenser sinensis]